MNALGVLRSPGTATGGGAAAPERPARPAVLVVDDDAAVREAVGHILGGEYRVVPADGATAALSGLRREAYHVVLTDLRMSGMDGIEFLSHLRGVDPDVPALVMTGFGTVQSAADAIRLGITAWISKPFTVAALRSVVADACAREETRRRERAALEQLRHQAAAAESARLERNVYAGILHDLNSPLTFLVGMSELLRDEMTLGAGAGPGDIRAWAERAEQLRRQAAYCGELSNRSVRYVRESHSAPGADIARTFEDLTHILRAHPAARGNHLVVRPAPAGLRTRIAAPELLRVLVNLGVNALQSGDHPHRVEFDVWPLAEAVDLDSLNARSPGILVGRETFLNRTPLLAVSVRDNGPGISPEILPRLFHSVVSTKDEQHGTGLGLTVVLRAVVEAGGAIHLRSQPGRGACFTVFLPG